MQGVVRAVRLNSSIFRNAILQHVRVIEPSVRSNVIARFESVSPSRLEEHGFESTTIADILKGKGKSADGSWLWCTTDDTVYDAVKSIEDIVIQFQSFSKIMCLILSKWSLVSYHLKMQQYKLFNAMWRWPAMWNTSACMVRLKCWLVERHPLVKSAISQDYLRKIIVQGRSSKSTKVGDIMTEENKLITVTSDTKVLRAMQLMTENRIRHIPVVEDKKMVGMVSIGDVVRAVVDEHREELKRLNAYIQGGY